MVSLLALLMAALAFGAAFLERLGDFHLSPRFAEQVQTGTIDGEVRCAIIAPADLDAKLPTLIVLYATPNGSSNEETLGRRPKSAAEWRFDAQHLAAQIRRLRQLRPNENTVVACLEAPGKSWPAWRERSRNAEETIRRIVENMLARFPGSPKRIALMGHSGGGSFLLGFLDAVDRVPGYVERIAFLDANYSYSDERKHGDKLSAWLKNGAGCRLVVIAYDDRTVTLEGKPIVPPDGGTYRASIRMIDRLGRDRPLMASVWHDFDVFTDGTRQVGFFSNRNYANRILHSALVGDMNGVLQALTFGAADEKAWGVFGGRRAYTQWIEPADDAETPEAIPPRSPEAETGATFMKRIAAMSSSDREAEILRAALGGNIPDFLRCFRRITIRGKDSAGAEHAVALDVTSDYLSIGSDSDFCRIPMAPATAQAIASRFGCLLPTPLIVNEIYRSAEVRLVPRPLTEEREAVTTFVQHNTIIEEQRAGIPCGPIIAGTKKDIVISNKLLERPHRVAIYGWHRPDGKAIQPLATVHGDTYVDYSHGIRLISRRVLLDGQAQDLEQLLQDPNLAPLLSHEGTMRILGY